GVLPISAILPHAIEPIAVLPIDAVLAEALLKSLAEYGEQLHGRRVWLACSGGRDSLALAALCVQLYRHGKLPFLPQLLHVNHHLQAASGAWAQHVANWAKAQNIPCRIRSEEHTSELQSRENLVCRLLLEKKKDKNIQI